jgi:large subunit ribosomal protein L21
MYAIIETGGKQYRVQEGDVINVEKLKVAAEDKIEFDKVLVYSDGASVTVGTPVLETAKVFGTVIENGKAEKVIIFKYKSKKDYRKKQGHRQPYTKVRIIAIAADGQMVDFEAKSAAAKAAEKTVAPKAGKPATKPAVKKAEKKTVAKEEIAVAKKAVKPATKKAAPKAAPKTEKPAAKKAVKKDK